MEPDLDLQYYLAILRRRLLYFVLPAVLIALGGVALAYLLPPIYKASATILVESQQIPTALASPTVTASADERIQVIAQRLLARDNLLEIAGKFELYANRASRLSPTEIVDIMRDAISIEQIDVGTSGARRDAPAIGFTVRFGYRNPTTASRVTNELVSSILTQNIETRLSRASETSDFFERQLNDVEQRLLELETRIAEFKRENESALPETLGERRLRRAQLSAQLAEIDQRIRAASLPGGASALSADAANSEQLNYSLRAKELQLQSYREERDKLAPLADRGFVAENRIRELDRTIEMAELDTEALRARIASQGGVVQDNEQAVAFLRDQRAELNAQIEALNESISRTPVVDVQLNSMTRDYENLQIEYRQAQARLEDALTGERLEENRQAERFEVIEQATVPTEPSEPNRTRIMLAGSAGGLAAGALLVILLEMLDKSVRTAADLERRLQIRPIAVIPYVRTSEDVWRKRWRFIGLIVVAIVFLSALLIAIHLYYRPLDVLMETIWQRLMNIASLG